MPECSNILYRLNGEPKESGAFALLPLQNLLVGGVELRSLVARVPLCVFEAIVDSHSNRDDGGHSYGADQDTMTLGVLRAVGR